MLGGPEPDNTASESTRSGQSALVSSHPVIQRGKCKESKYFLAFQNRSFLVPQEVCLCDNIFTRENMH